MKTVIRHWHILRMIPRLPRKTTAAAIHDALLKQAPASILTKRTVERDLHELSAAFPLVRDGAKPQGWSWRKDAAPLDIPGMDLAEALTLRMAEEYLSRLLPRSCLASLSPHMRRAREVLGLPGQGGMAEWPGKVSIVPRTQPLIPPEIDPQVLDVLYEALFRGIRITGRYGALGQGAREYELNPLGMVFNDPVVYLVATCRDYTDILLFAVHRFTSAQLIDHKAVMPEQFNLQEYIESGALGFRSSSPEKIGVSLRFEEAAACHLRESPLALGQTISDERDGKVTVEAEVADTWQFRWWLLGFGSQVEVLGPAALREEIAEQIRKMGHLYAQGGDGSTIS